VDLVGEKMKGILSAIALSGIAFGGWIGYASLSTSAAAVTGRERVVHAPFDSSIIDLQIRNNERAVSLDPGAALNWSMMSSAYLARSTESDDAVTAVKAEMAARRSIQIRKLGNGSGWNRLVQSLLQEHRFKDALAQCEGDEAAKIADDTTTQLHVDCLIEIGRYDDAGLLISKNPRAFSDASGKTIVARLLDVGGKPGDAIALLRHAASEVDANGGMPSNAVAWFHTRLAMQLAKTGHHAEAETEFRTALAMYPRDYKALAGMARLAAQDGRWHDVVIWGNRSDQVAQMADVRALVADAYAKLSDTKNAEEGYARVAALVGRPSGLTDGLHEVAPNAGTHGHRLDRQYAIFCADHDRDPVGAYAAALRDFDARHDVYAFDTLAWVCLATGNRDEAVKSIDRALVRGTRDPMLLYHAGAIYASAGEKAKAARFLSDALAIDPHFDGIAAPKATTLLQSLQSSQATR
jgi:tetratricopeptide (TPR) repeat protein